jgi:putative solute:sodium symporter small subunit
LALIRPVPYTACVAEPNDNRARYWRANLRILTILLAIWFVVSFGLGILFVEPLNAFRVGGFPVGFWFSQQGAIYVFIVLIFVYARWMDRVDREHGVD